MPLNLRAHACVCIDSHAFSNKVANNLAKVHPQLERGSVKCVMCPRSGERGRWDGAFK